MTKKINIIIPIRGIDNRFKIDEYNNMNFLKNNRLLSIIKSKFSHLQ